MSKVKRRCICRQDIEAEPDDVSVAHALRVHYAQPEHQDAIAGIEAAEAAAPSIDVPIRNGWAGVTAALTRVQ